MSEHQNQNPNPNQTPDTEIAIEPEVLIPLLDSPDFPVDARNLHHELGVKTLFKDWMARRISEYKFEENQDFISLLKIEQQKKSDDSEATEAPSLVEFFSQLSSLATGTKDARGGQNRKDYHITFDMAKELAMVEKTDRGREYRRYFIDCENTLREIAAKNSLPAPTPPPAIDFSKLLKTLDYLDMLAPRFAQYLAMRQAGIPLEMSARALGRGDEGCRPLDKVLRSAGLIKLGKRLTRKGLSTRPDSPTLSDVPTEEVN